jgi:hypothetical protein
MAAGASSCRNTARCNARAAIVLHSIMQSHAVAELTDSDIIARVARRLRDPRRHNQRLFRAAAGIVKSAPEAEDVVQQTAAAGIVLHP